MELQEFGEFIHLLRIGKGLTTKEVSTATGVDRTMIDYIERGHYRSFPKHGTMKNLAKFFREYSSCIHISNCISC